MRNLYVYSSNHSEGAKNLASALGARRVKRQGSNLVGSPRKTVVNWGASTLPHNVEMCSIVNRPAAVKCASDKAAFFELLSRKELGNLAPPYTRDREEAENLFDTRDARVVCRTLLKASGGDGIVIANNRTELVAAPLYVKYIRKMSEYRVHLMREGLVFDVQKKVVRSGHEPVSFLIRNHDAGFIYQRQGLATPPTVLDVATQAFNATGLDFGAVDVVWSARKERAYVLEVNTAPGLEGRTIELYAQMIREIVE